MRRMVANMLCLARTNAALGLAIVKSIIELHRGEVDVREPRRTHDVRTVFPGPRRVTRASRPHTPIASRYDMRIRRRPTCLPE